MAKTLFRSRTLAAVHEGATDLFELGFIDRQTMREYDRLCVGIRGRRRRVRPLEKLREALRRSGSGKRRNSTIGGAT
jgi:DNA-binding transcriptional regulator YiaG